MGGDRARPEERRGTKGWQLALVVPALAALSLGVLVPVAAMIIVAGQICAAVVGVSFLGRFSPPQRELDAVPMVIALALVGGGLMMATVSLFKELLRTGPRPPARVLDRLFQRPWLAIGVGLTLASFAILPGAAGKPTASTLTMSVLCGATLWWSLTSFYVAARFSRWALRGCWSIARASPFGAGFLMAAGLICGLFLYAAANVLDALEQPMKDLSTCRPQDVDCYRRQLARWTPPAASSWPAPGLAVSATREQVPASLHVRDHYGARDGLRTVFTANTGRFSGLPSDDSGSPFSECLDQLDGSTRAEARLSVASIVGVSDAEDVVQDVLIRVCLRSPPPADFRAYFFKAVKYRALKWSQRAAWACPMAVLPEPRCSLAPDEDFLGVGFADAVNKAFCLLDEQEQAIFVLRRFESRGYAEIAERLGLSEHAVRQRFSRAERKFEEKIRFVCQ